MRTSRYPVDQTKFQFLAYSLIALDNEIQKGRCAMSIIQRESATSKSTEAMDRILAHHAKFLNFLTSRMEDKAAAEDILQSAYIKAIEHGSEIRDDESTVAWFYRTLRNAVTDHYRRSSTRTRAHETYSAELPVSFDPEFAETACACVGDVIHDLKDEYREAIEQVDLCGVSVESFAQSQQTNANNVSVRLHRARKAVAKKLIAVCGACAQHRCLDCTCRRSQL
jgi:RNA polymerase sigma factor (sigma-70 family)